MDHEIINLKKTVITCISNQSKGPYQEFLMPICEEKHKIHYFVGKRWRVPRAIGYLDRKTVMISNGVLVKKFKKKQRKHLTMLKGTPFKTTFKNNNKYQFCRVYRMRMIEFTTVVMVYGSNGHHQKIIKGWGGSAAMMFVNIWITLICTSWYCRSSKLFQIWSNQVTLNLIN